MKLTDEQRALLKLIQRSPDRGDGWRTVSKQLWASVQMWAVDDLVEMQPEPIGSAATAGRIRLTERGQAVCDYL